MLNRNRFAWLVWCGAFFMLALSPMQAQTPDCKSIMVCNDRIQVSLDDDCSVPIVANMVLEAQAYPNSMYTVEVKRANGTVVSNAAVTSAHIGELLSVKVTLNGCPNSCWGNITVEDKLAPVVETCPCTENASYITGTIRSNSPSYARQTTLACTATQNVKYILDTIMLSNTSLVSLTTSSASVSFSLYANNFTASSSCTNLLATNITTFNGVLSAGIPYIIAISAQSPSTIISAQGLPFRIDMDAINGAIANICALPCTAEQAFLNQTTTNAYERPVFRDACDGTNLTYTKSDVVTDLGCSAPYGRKITRFWTATDKYGNKMTKEQVFFVKKGNLSDIVWPLDYDGTDRPAFTCNTNLTLLPNGAPAPVSAPAGTGSPQGINCRNFQSYYNDILFDLCGAGLKVLRQWVVIDWCTGQSETRNQIIKIVDDAPPICVSPPDLFFEATTDPNKCTGTFDVPPPTVIFECSEWTYYVGYKLRSPDGTPFDTPSFDNVSGDATNGYTITNLPQDTTWVVYFIEDACGNSTMCFTEVYVQDKQPPTPVCEGNTVISIDNEGSAKLYATSLDDHSSDNCALDKFEIRRKSTTCAAHPEDLEFGEFVHFCCSDITTPASYVRVVLKVYDKAGNTNICEANVQVQDKKLPVIKCPNNITLQCGQDHTSTAITGVATATDNCITIITSTLSGSLNTCGKGSVSRAWRATDPNGNSASCNQSITVTDNTPFGLSNIVFPGDISITSCNLGDATPEVLNSRPTFTNSECTNLTTSYDDQIFYQTTEACVKIVRTWRVIDWCNYSPVNGPIYEKIQIIKLLGSAAPTFTTSCANITLDQTGENCELLVNLSSNATDPCSAPEDIIYRWTMDVSNNGSVDFTGSGKNYSAILPVGIHRVAFYAMNRCGKESVCSYTITIRDRKKPTPVCIAEVVWVLDQDGSTEIWASDFNLKSFDNCTPEAGLRYSFNVQGNQPGRRFTCADIPNGQVANIPVKMFVLDNAGNSDFCDVTLILQDSPVKNACPDVNNLLPKISGNITTYQQVGIENIEVGLTNMINAERVKDMTNENGNYVFEGVNVFSQKTVDANKNDDIMNGVSTLDLVLIQRHILGITPFETPYHLLSADINNSRSITTSDLVMLRKMILGVTNEFENNSSWRFIPKGFEFSDPQFPYDFPNKVNIDSLFNDKNDVNFIALKVGDVNHSARVNAKMDQTESRNGQVEFMMPETAYKTGDIVEAPVFAGDNMQLTGAQFTITFDPQLLSFKGINAGQWNISAEHFNAANATNGNIAISFDCAKGMDLIKNEKLFTILFESVNNGNLDKVDFTSALLDAEAYNTVGEVMQMRLSKFAGSAPVNSANFLHQNEPNPFSGKTNISFLLAEDNQVQLNIFDINGKLIFQSPETQMSKGLNKIEVRSEMLQGNPGMYYYQLKAGNLTETKKMILIE